VESLAEKYMAVLKIFGAFRAQKTRR